MTEPIRATQRRVEDPGGRVLAAIDVGTTSIRLGIAQILPDGQVSQLERLERPVGLGHDTFRRGRLRNETMRVAVGILRDYQAVLRTYRVDQVRAVATSAVREASNGETFLDRVWMATALEVRTISGAEESRLMISAVRETAGKLLKGRKRALIAQVGGGSTVLNLLVKGRLKATQTLPLGTIRQQEVLATSRESTAAAASLIAQQVRAALASFAGLLDLEAIETVLTVGAALRWAVRQIGRGSPDEAVWSLTRADLDTLLKRCLGLSVTDLVKIHGLSPAEAEALVPSLLIHQSLVAATRAETIWVPRLSMLDGLLREMARGVLGVVDESIYDQTRQSALALAEKYHADVKHARQVADLSVRLFDVLQPIHRLDHRCRLLLEVAALVREIGMYVSSRAHHKHSLYLLTHSELFGLTQEEIQIVANVARYYRRSRPKPTHLDYVQLSRERRMVVNKLAAILRVADAVDSGRRGLTVQAIDVDDDTLRIVVPRGWDTALEKKELAAKSDMLQDLYGLAVRLETGKTSQSNS